MDIAGAADSLLAGMPHAEEMKLLGFALVGCHAVGWLATRDHLASHAVPQLLGVMGGSRWKI